MLVWIIIWRVIFRNNAIQFVVFPHSKRLLLMCTESRVPEHNGSMFCELVSSCFVFSFKDARMYNEVDIVANAMMLSKSPAGGAVTQSVAAKKDWKN